MGGSFHGYEQLVTRDRIFEKALRSRDIRRPMAGGSVSETTFYTAFYARRRHRKIADAKCVWLYICMYLLCMFGD